LPLLKSPKLAGEDYFAQKKTLKSLKRRQAEPPEATASDVSTFANST